MKNKILYASALIILAASLSAAAKETQDNLSGKEIAKLAEENNSFNRDNASATVKMVINTGRGIKRERVIESKMKKDGNVTKKYIRFKAPPDVKGTAFLGVEEKGKDTEQWIYLDKKARRIKSNQKNTSFMGTDFTYKDMAGRDIDKAEHKKLGDETINGTECWVVESTPKDPKEETYSKYISYVAKKTKVLMKVRFFDLDGKELKVLEVKKLQKIEGRDIATESEMKNLKEGSSTLLTVEAITFKEKIGDDVFTVQNLERGAL